MSEIDEAFEAYAWEDYCDRLEHYWESMREELNWGASLSEAELEEINESIRYDDYMELWGRPRSDRLRFHKPQARGGVSLLFRPDASGLATLSHHDRHRRFVPRSGCGAWRGDPFWIGPDGDRASVIEKSERWLAD